MNIVLASDNNFVQHCAVTMVSVLKNNDNVVFYLLTEGLSDEYYSLLEDLVVSYKGKIHFVIVPTEVIQNLPMPEGMGKHISIATYYRLLIEKLLPEDVDRVIYLDCDIVVRKSLWPLWNTDLDDYALAAVYQHNEWAYSNNSFGRLDYSSNYGYFNAGVLLINLTYWKVNDITSNLMEFIKNKYNAIRSHDQDVLNAVLHHKTKALSCNWNMLAVFFMKKKIFNTFTFPKHADIENLESITKDPAVIHFAARPKPWEYACNHVFKYEYFKYLKYTHWIDWKPNFSLRNIIDFRILPEIFKFRRKILSIIKK